MADNDNLSDDEPTPVTRIDDDDDDDGGGGAGAKGKRPNKTEEYDNNSFEEDEDDDGKAKGGGNAANVELSDDEGDDDGKDKSASAATTTQKTEQEDDKSAAADNYKRAELQVGDSTVHILTSADLPSKQENKKMTEGHREDAKAAEDKNTSSSSSAKTAKSTTTTAQKTAPAPAKKATPAAAKPETGPPKKKASTAHFIVSIELCKDCHRHQMSTKHDESKYKSYFDKVSDSIRFNFESVDIELKEGTPQLGAFEVYITTPSMTSELVYSKIKTRQFPNPSQIATLIEKRISEGPSKNQQNK